MSPDTLPGQRGRRREARHAQRQQRLRRSLIALGVLLALLLAGGLAAARSGDGEGSDPGAGEQPQRTQRTLLVQVRGSGDVTVSNALLAHDPATREGSALLVPPQVLATAPGSQPVPFGQVLRSTSPQSSRNALADLLGVTVDSSWVLDAAGLAQLVDQLGGITAEVDVQVLGGAQGRQVLLAPGPQPLNGAQAVTLASYSAPGEQEQARLARLQEVLAGVLTALPDTQSDVLAALDRLGARSLVQGLDVTGLATLLIGLKADDAAAALQYDTVPVIAVETGADQASLRLDLDQVRAVVDRLLAASVPAGVRETGNRVKVFNGVGTPMLGSDVREKLVAAGLVYVPGGNASRFGIATTEIQIGEPTPEAQALGARVADALGLPASAVRTSVPTSVADVVVVVGADFVADGR